MVDEPQTSNEEVEVNNCSVILLQMKQITDNYGSEESLNGYWNLFFHQT